MPFLKYLYRERHKLIANALVATIGFFVALYANGRLDEWKERKSFATTLTAVRAEARSNNIALRESFLPLYKDGLILQELGTTTISQALANPLFVKHATATQLDTLTQYLRSISLANSYRAKAESIRFSESYFKASTEKGLKYWESSLVDAWTNNLSECERKIAAVLALP